jgi:arabinofuranosyltransferase
MQAQVTPTPEMGISIRRYRWIQVAYLLTGLVLCYGYFLFTVDDTFISLRYSENLSRGFGPVFNHGERVEGFSNPLWVIILALCDRLFGDLLLPAKLLSAFCYLTCGWILVRRLYQENIDPGPGALFYIASLPLVFWGVSGMETGLYSLLLLLWGMHVTQEKPSTKATLTLAVLLLLSRPEAPLPLLIGFSLLVWRRRLSMLTGTLFIFAGVSLILIRFAYYGEILPNTYYAKHFQMVSRWQITLMGYIRHYYLGVGLVPVLGLLAYGWQYRGKNELGLVSLALWPALFSLLVGGDWMPLWRFMIPSLPISLWLCARLFSAWSRSTGFAGPIVFCLAFALHVSLNVKAANAVQSWDFSPLTMQRIQNSVSGGNINYKRLVDWIKELSPQPVSMAVGELGYFGYYIPIPCVDLHGLVDSFIAKSQQYPNTVIGKMLPIGDPGFPDTELGQYLLKRNPQLLIITVDEVQGLTDPLFHGAYVHLKTVGNFMVFKQN